MGNIFLIIGIVVPLAVVSYIILNQLKKQEKLEDIVEKQNNFIIGLNDLMIASENRIYEIDQKGSFASDDEIGWFFQNIKDIQKQISEFIIRDEEEIK